MEPEEKEQKPTGLEHEKEVAVEVGKGAKKIGSVLVKTIGFIIAHPAIAAVVIVAVFIFGSATLAVASSLSDEAGFENIVEHTAEKSGRISSSGSSSSLNGSSASMVEAARKIHAYIREHQYTYSVSGSQLPYSVDALYTSGYVCCATYVWWVAYEAGYAVGDTPIHGCWDLEPKLREAGFQEISPEQRQDGDVVFFGTEHTQICAGPYGTWDRYNAGSTSAIRAMEPETSKGGNSRNMDTASTCILRAPAK